MQNVMARAWELYGVTRPALWAAGDETGARRFLPDLFRRMLDRAWDEVRKAAWHEAQREADRIAAQLVEKIRASQIDLARRMDPEVRANRIRGIAYELEGLTYSGFGVRARDRREELRQEMEILEEACRLEDEAASTGIGSAAALAIALSNLSLDDAAQVAIEGEQLARVA